MEAVKLDVYAFLQTGQQPNFLALKLFFPSLKLFLIQFYPTNFSRFNKIEGFTCVNKSNSEKHFLFFLENHIFRKYENILRIRRMSKDLKLNFSYTFI